MSTLLLLAVVVACIFSVCFRLAILHPFKTVHNAVVDCLKWVKYKQWRNLKTGRIISYCGLFGKGKTLSAVYKVVEIYNRYNNQLVYDFNRKKWVTQKVHVISNVELAIPYEKFKGLMQMVQAPEKYRKEDKKNDTLTCIIVLGDEFSVQLNSRKFKDNIDPLFLNVLLCCRHHHMSLYYTSQRFSHVDALLRQVTSFVVQCNKKWRFMVHSQYDAFALENATDPTLVRPIKRGGWFIEDKHFNAYDTLACVGNLTKSCKEGDMLTPEEILALQQNNGANMDVVLNPSRKAVKSMKKRTK